MKTIGSWLIIAMAGLVVLCSGCGTQRIVWSPDGARAAVLGEQGLYLSDAEGKVTGVLVSNVIMAEWFPDSRKLALVRSTKVQSWADLQSHLCAEDRDDVVQQGQAVLKELDAGKNWKVALKDHNDDAVTLYVKGAKGPALVWIVQPPVPLGLRVSPVGTAIAMTTEAGKRHGDRLMVVPSDGSAPGQIVSEEASGHPDWTKDGRSLVYINATGGMTSDDDVRLSSLTRRQVFNAAGAVEIQTNHDDLAGMLFDPNLGVRCLSDGRILFIALDVQLPVTAPDMPQRPQIFALDPRHQATLTRLIPRSVLEGIPDRIGFFEISPDEKKVLMAASKGAVMILSLADGNLTTVQAAGNDDPSSFPSWRGSDEVCYLSASPTNSEERAWEVSLWKNGATRVISTNWPLELRNKFLNK